MENKIQINTKIQFDSLEEAKIVFESILPEVKDHRFERSQVNIELDDESIEVNVKSQDITAAKANIVSMLRWIALVSESIQIFPQKIVKDKDKLT